MTSAEGSFPIVDRRGRTASGLQVGNLTTEMNRLRQAGINLPHSDARARTAAARVTEMVNTPGSLSESSRVEAQMRRARMSSMQRTGSNLQMAMPRIREPLGSLSAKNIPCDIGNPEELARARAWSRLYYATHDLVPLLVDIYSRFPLTGLEFRSTDPKIESFFTEMFMDDLGYEDFLPNALGREYFLCLTPETPVMTSRGHRAIQDVAEGDFVLTRSGDFRQVMQTTVTPVDEEVVSIRPRFGQPVRMTSKHRVWARRNGVAQWLHADEIRGQQGEGTPDQVFVPVFRGDGVSHISLWDHLQRDQWRSFSEVIADPPNKDSGSRGNTVKGIARMMTDGAYGPDDIFSAAGYKRQAHPYHHRFEITDDFLWFLGVVIGDGGISLDKGTLRIVFSGHEMGLAERTSKIWNRITGRPGVIKSVQNWISVECNDWTWVHVLRDMTYTEDGSRRLPEWFVNLSGPQAEALYLGLSQSDGYLHKSGLCFTQSDPYLIQDVAFLARKFDMVPRVYNLGCHETSCSKKDQYVIRPGSHQSYFEWVDGGYWVTVWKTAREHYVGNVYDLTVQDEHSFVTSGFVVHNCGEVTLLGHFDEELGVWTAEEILDPDMVRVSKSMFVDQERVQLAAKELVDSLREPPNGKTESRSEQLDRQWQLKELTKYYPEIIAAAAQDDGLDIAEPRWSRIVNRVSPWDLRGIPPLMRSFGTLMLEESLISAQDAVADRLYAPMIVATLGLQDMGDGQPWIPTQDDLGALRDDMQSALMADFKLITHHMGLKVESVFGRESVPRFDTDFDRVDLKLMQAWGIGQALIMGGTSAAGTYASSALNREVVELNMRDFQRKVVAHIRKRAEVVAEAQRFYAYDKKGSLRIPQWRKVQRFNEETGQKEVVKAPKLLIPTINFRSLNLRDEATERQFYMDLRNMGVPVSDKTLAINLDTDFDEEIPRQAEETVDKLVAQAQAMAKAKQIIDEQNRALPIERQIPYPPDMINYLTQTLMLRQQLAAAEMAEGQADMMEQQAQAMTPAGQLGVLPPPAVMPPAPQDGQQETAPPEPALNRARPPESDEMRAGMPRAAKKGRRRGVQTDGDAITRKQSWIERPPSSYGDRYRVDSSEVEQAVHRREVTARHSVPLVSELVDDPGFFQMLNMGHLENQIRGDYPEVVNGKAQDSGDLLREMVQQYEALTGQAPRWD